MPESISSQLNLPLLPEYSVRISKRAKTAQIQVSQQGHIEIVVPTRFNLKRVNDFVAENQAWLDKALERLQPQTISRENRLPRHIKLRAVQEQWIVCYRHHSCPKYRQQKDATQKSVLEIFAANQDDSWNVLHQWLTHRAREILMPRLRQLSIELGLPFGKVVVRSQKTRWGSCSSVQTISINRSLLFLPTSIVHYLFVHELCHTVHANHSKTYWRLVEKIEPAYQRLESELHEAGKYVPSWAIPECATAGMTIVE